MPEVEADALIDGDAVVRVHKVERHDVELTDLGHGVQRRGGEEVALIECGERQ